MDLSTTLILAVAAILGMNQLIFRLPGWEQRRSIFWSIQFLNLLDTLRLGRLRRLFRLSVLLAIKVLTLRSCD